MSQVNSRSTENFYSCTTAGQHRSTICGSHSLPIQRSSIRNPASQHRENGSRKLPAGKFVLRYSAQHETHFHVHGSSLLLLFIALLLLDK